MTIVPFYQESQSWDDLGIDTRGRRSGEVKTLCPKCSHQRKHKRDLCLSINVDEGFYNCHNCGWSGRLLGGQSTPSRPSYERERKVYATPIPVSQEKTVNQWAQELLIARGISMETLIDAGVCGTRQKMPKTQQMEDVVAFPFRRNGEVVNYKFYRPEEDGGKQCKMVYEAERIWYGLDWCHDAEQIIIVEGEIDALSMREAGVFHQVQLLR
jgi:twinkle protein